MMAMGMKKGMVTVLAVALTCVLLLTNVAAASKDKEIKVREVQVTPSKVTVYVNQTRTLSTYITPYNAEDKSIYWESSNPDIVVVDEDGEITAIAPGTAEVTATSENGRVGRCTVTVPDRVIKAIEPDIENKDRPESELNGGEVLTAAVLRLEVEQAVKEAPKGERVTVTYRDKSLVSTAALRSAAYTAEYEGGSVQLRLQTGGANGSGIQGQLTIDPKQASTEDLELRLGVYTTGDSVDSVKEKVNGRLGGGAAVIRLAHEGSYGMTVKVAAKADLSGLDLSKLVLYTYDNSSDGYALLHDQTTYIDENGFLHFSAGHGGYIVVTDKAPV